MKTKFPCAVAMAVARELSLRLADSCVRLQFAGSLRRGKPEVGDVELVYIPDFRSEPDGLFDSRRVNLADAMLDDLLRAGVIAKRRNVHGSEMWGEKNKLAVHVASGVPVDFFATSEASWFNYLVCRTGGKESNMAIADAALRKGWRWHPYAGGFTDGEGNPVRVTCEEDAFRLVGLPALAPWDRP